MANFLPFMPFPRHNYYNYYNSYPNYYFHPKNNDKDMNNIKKEEISTIINILLIFNELF